MAYRLSVGLQSCGEYGILRIDGVEAFNSIQRRKKNWVLLQT